MSDRTTGEGLYNIGEGISTAGMWIAVAMMLTALLEFGTENIINPDDAPPAIEGSRQ